MRKLNVPFVTTDNKEDSFYELIGDWELIEASFAQQYGIRLRREDEMSWDEFTTLLAGLNGDTPLGRIVSIRSESNPDRIKQFTAAEKKIRKEWAMRHRRVVSDKKEYDATMAGFHSMFKALSEKGG